MLEIAFILIFILLNGFFSASEIAVVTSRKSFVRNLSEKGNPSAKTLLKLQSEPDRFFATVQVGVTLMGGLASAVGGAAAVTTLKPLLMQSPVPFISRAAEPISIGIAVIIISYFSFTIGEIIPKSIAFRNPEKVGLFVAKPVAVIMKLTSSFIGLLTASSNILLKPFGTKTFSERALITEEEIKLLVEEGTDRGIFEATEHELIHGVFKFADISAKGVMVPYASMISFNINESPDVIIKTISEENFSRYPVFDKDKADVKGILYNKDIFNELAAGRPISVNRLLHSALFIPETMMISALMREMQKKRQHMAIVVDEYGSVVGLVTIEDLIEEIVGEIRDEYDTEVPVQPLKNGSVLIDASLAVRDLNEDHDFNIPESNDYDSISGFLISSLQRLPSVGDSFDTDTHKFTIVSMKGRRILKVKAEKIHSEADR